MLQVEGGAAIGAYKGRESAAAHSWEVSGLSQQYAQNYCDSLRKVRKFPKRIAIAELNRQFGLQVPAPTNQLIYQVILRHLDNIYTGELFAKPAKERYFCLPPVVWWLWV